MSSIAARKRPALLLVEDDYHLAAEVGRAIETRGAELVGPAGSVRTALAMLGPRRIDGAVLDVNLHGEMVFPVAYELKRRGVPFLFTTGYDDIVIPSDLSDVPLHRKPIDPATALDDLDDLRDGGPASESAPSGIVLPAGGNGLLSRLEPATAEALVGLGDVVGLVEGDVVAADGAPTTEVLLPTDGLISLRVVGTEGENVASALIGREGLVGVPAVLGVPASPQRAIVQVGGSALRLPLHALRRRVEADPAMAALFTRYLHTLHLQAAYAALANARYTVERRVARLLLMCQDRLGRVDIPIKHAALAEMLGTRRSGVTIAIQILEGERVLKATRGNIRILSRPRLEAAAGGSYGGPETAYDAILGRSPTPEDTPRRLNLV